MSNFMTDTNYKCVINKTNIKIKNVSCLWLQVLPSSNNMFSYMSLAMSPKYFKFIVQIPSKYLQLYDSNFDKA